MADAGKVDLLAVSVAAAEPNDGFHWLWKLVVACCGSCAWSDIRVDLLHHYPRL